MDDARAVRLVERIADLNRDPQCVLRLQSAPCRVAATAAAGEAFGDRLPFQMLQHEEVDAVLVADVEQGADVRMIQRRDRARLAFEALAQLRVGRERGGENLDRDRPIEPRVAGLVDLAHAACPEGGEDLVRAEAGAGGQGQTLAVDYKGGVRLLCVDRPGWLAYYPASLRHNPFPLPRTAHMQIAERTVGNVVILDLSGPITVNKGADQEFKDKINSLVHQGNKNILANMAGVTMVDSSGLGEIVAAYTTVSKAGGSMKLVNLTKRLHDLLSITKLLTVFDTYDSEPEALRNFS